MSTSPTLRRMPTYFLSHGGGPWPYLQGPMRARFALLEAALKDIPQQLPEQPRAVLVVSGHWEEINFTVSSSPNPGMVYDYYGFPEEAYRIRYPAPGSPELATRVSELLSGAGWTVRHDPQRGFDHGTFSLLTPMYPKADVPIVQLSLKSTLDPEEHFAAGQALASLRDDGILIIGSGQSYHNLANWGAGNAGNAAVFDGWLRRTLLRGSPQDRRAELVEWAKAPAARESHPREDHLIPLMVAAGAALDEPATCVYGEFLMGMASSSFRFGADRTPSKFDSLSAAGKR